MEKTCKDCEHYEEAIKKAIGSSYLMICPKYGESNVISKCQYYFTSKEPKKEKECATCKIRVKPVCLHCDIDTHSLWQPIEKPETIYPVEAQKRRQQQVDYADLVDIGIKGGEKSFFAKINNTSKYERIEETETPKRKEPKMKITKLIFWPIRRYVGVCAIYCTAKICIFLNPLVCKLWHVILPKDFWDEKPGNDFFASWCFTVCAIAGVILALYLYNQFCKRLFGEK